MHHVHQHDQPDVMPVYGLDDYQVLASRTLKDVAEVRQHAAIWGHDPHQVLHAALGLGTEAGEVLDHVKRSEFYGKPMLPEALAEEAGDALWYVSLLATALGMTLSQIASRNIDKLRRRYPDGFSEVAALRRADKDGTPEDTRVSSP